MTIAIQAVTVNQANILSFISSKCFYDTFYRQNTEEDMRIFLQENFTKEKLVAELEDSSNYFFFARVEGKIAGYLKLSTAETPPEINSTNIEIARIYALEEKIGFGIGKTLMQFALDFAKTNNKKTVWLGVWEHNERAIRFYQRHGFEKFGEHIFMVGTDAQTDWLMKKEL